MNDNQKSKQICFVCPGDLYDWLVQKMGTERRNLSSAIVHAIQVAKDAEEIK